MRLWHEDLIPKLPKQQLLGQWRECIALLGNGWGKKHSTVDYIFKYYESYLVAYTIKVAREMRNRNYNINTDLINKALQKRHNLSDTNFILSHGIELSDLKLLHIYPEHNEQYYQECIENLRKKGIEIE